MQARRILIMGLPGSGKTTLANKLTEYLERADKKVIRLNADQVRKEHDDWDFSIAGRIRQSYRMRELADRIECDFVVCDFVAPLPKMREIFDADVTIWMDTIESGRYDDTNQMFVVPEVCDYRITEKNAERWAQIICQALPFST